MLLTVQNISRKLLRLNRKLLRPADATGKGGGEFRIEEERLLRPPWSDRIASGDIRVLMPTAGHRQAAAPHPSDPSDPSDLPPNQDVDPEEVKMEPAPAQEPPPAPVMADASPPDADGASPAAEEMAGFDLRSELSKLGVSDLRKKIQEKGLEIPGGAKKADLIEIIINSMESE